MTAEDTPQAQVAATPPAASAVPPEHQERLRLVVTYPDTATAVVTTSGEIDAATLEHLQEALGPRLVAAVQMIVVDLNAVEFLSIEGLELLNQARLRAQARGVVLRLVTTGHETRHALHVAGLDLLCCTSLSEALNEDHPRR